MNSAYIRVTQVVDRMSDDDDRDFMPAGADYEGSYHDYPTTIENEQEALANFSRLIPISMPEEFIVEFVPSMAVLQNYIQQLQRRVARLEKTAGLNAE